MTVLALLGTALLLAAAVYAQYRVAFHTAWLGFFAGFGAVHLPAAIILFVKRARGSGSS